MTDLTHLIERCESGEYERYLKKEIAKLEAAAPLSARETVRYLWLERSLSALEGSKASLADATQKEATHD